MGAKERHARLAAEHAKKEAAAHEAYLHRHAKDGEPADATKDEAAATVAGGHAAHEHHSTGAEARHRHLHASAKHHADEDELLERSMTEGATKEKPERQFEHKISAKAAHAAVEGAHHQVADGVKERHDRLAGMHSSREAAAHEAHQHKVEAGRSYGKVRAPATVHEEGLEA